MTQKHHYGLQDHLAGEKNNDVQISEDYPRSVIQGGPGWRGANTRCIVLRAVG